MPTKPKQLHKAVFAITLPKTSTARTCTVLLTALHTIRKLLDELVVQPQQTPPDPRVTELSSKIDALADKLDTLAATQPTSYADIVRCSTPSRQHTCSPPKASPIVPRAPVHPPQAPSHPAVARDTSLDVVLTPKDSRCPAFIGDSPAVVLARFNELMLTTKPLGYPVSARAIARLRNGNLRLTLNQEGAADDLTDKQALWLPDFSPLLSIHVPQYPIIVHRVPTTFNLYCCASPGPDSSCNGDYCNMMRENSLCFPELPTHAQLRWVSPLAKRPSKTHSSIIMFLPYNKDLASQIIQERFAINGILLRTEKYHFPPVQCYNCFHFGHTAAHCLWALRRPTHHL